MYVVYGIVLIALKPFLSLNRIKTLIKREEEKSKRAETKMGQMLSAKEPEGYAECYPGMSEMNDAIDDSDDEADYSKMDLVSKLFVLTKLTFTNQLKSSVSISRVKSLTIDSKIAEYTPFPLFGLPLTGLLVIRIHSVPRYPDKKNVLIIRTKVCFVRLTGIVRITRTAPSPR